MGVLFMSPMQAEKARSTVGAWIRRCRQLRTSGPARQLQGHFGGQGSAVGATFAERRSALLQQPERAGLQTVDLNRQILPGVSRPLRVLGALHLLGSYSQHAPGVICAHSPSAGGFGKLPSARSPASTAVKLAKKPGIGDSIGVAMHVCRRGASRSFIRLRANSSRLRARGSWNAS